MTETNSESGDGQEADDESPFDKLDLAKDHSDRANRLEAEAKQQVHELVEPEIPFDAEVRVSLSGEVFTVTVLPDPILDDLKAKSDGYVDIQTPLKFRIGKWDLLDQGERRKNVKHLVGELEMEHEDGAPFDEVIEKARRMGIEESKVVHEIDKLKQKGEVYEPSTDHLRTT